MILAWGVQQPLSDLYRKIVSPMRNDIKQLLLLHYASRLLCVRDIIIFVRDGNEIKCETCSKKKIIKNIW